MKVKVNNTYYKIKEVKQVAFKSDDEDMIYWGACYRVEEKIELLKSVSKSKKKSLLTNLKTTKWKD